MPAKKPAKKAASKTTAVANVSRKEVWAGTSSISGPRSEADAKNMMLIQKVAEAFSLPPIGVNILGGKPYINKEGLLYKLHQYSSAKKKGEGRLKGIRKEFIAYAVKVSDTAVMKATIEYDNDTYLEGIGEASPANVSKGMDKVAASLNMLAETRAVNRAIRQAITFDLWAEAMARFATIADDAERKVLEEAVTTSVEEMDQEDAVPRAKLAEKSTEGTLQGAVMNAINGATKKETLNEIKGKVELSDKISEQGKKILLSMLENKLKTL